ncbi:MAG: DnaD domain protein [Clostridia bacterium]|nr:DnaD domain protein [Clostridia bacterium]
MSYNIDFGSWGAVFAVPSSVVDKGLKLASESQLKVLLYLLRHSGESVTDESVSQALGIHTEDVRDAITYWADKGLLVRLSDSITLPTDSPAKSVSGLSDAAKEQPTAPANSEKRPRPISRATKPEPAYVAKRLKTDKNIVFLMDEAQRILSKVLSNTDVATLLMLHDTDGLPIEVILMLMEHCIQIGKGNMRYIERTGINWASEGITTITLAEEKIKRYSESTTAWATVCAVFGLHLSGTPTKKQLEFSDIWINNWKFSEDMLRLAYERCVDTKGELNLSYINGILRRWNEQSLRKPEDVINADSVKSEKTKKNQKKSAGTDASYDIDEYENFSIFDD